MNNVSSKKMEWIMGADKGESKRDCGGKGVGEGRGHWGESTGGDTRGMEHHQTHC